MPLVARIFWTLALGAVLLGLGLWIGHGITAFISALGIAAGFSVAAYAAERHF